MLIFPSSIKVQQILCSTQNKSLNVSPDIQDLVEKLAKTQISPGELAGASLAATNATTANVFVATAIASMDKQYSDNLAFCKDQLRGSRHDFEKIYRRQGLLYREVRRLRKWKEAVEPDLSKEAKERVRLFHDCDLSSTYLFDFYDFAYRFPL